MRDDRLDDDELEYEDEDDRVDGPEAASADRTVWVQFRARGVRGPKTASGNRGRVCWEGAMPRGAVAYLQRLEIGPEAGLCEPLSIWMCEAPGSDPWEQVNSTAQTPGQRQEQIDRVQQEHEQQMQAAATALQGARADCRDVDLQLEFVKKRLALEQATLDRMQQEIEIVRSSLDHERRRCDEERELLKVERAQRLQERALLAQQDAAERQARQEQAAKTHADIQTLVGAAADQFRLTLETNKQTIAALKEGLTAEVAATKGLIQQEQTLQQIIQTAKLNAVHNASELKERMDSVPAPSGPGPQQPIPYLELMDKAIAGLGMGIAMATGKPIPGMG
jgi:hypothetical protein